MLEIRFNIFVDEKSKQKEDGEFKKRYIVVSVNVILQSIISLFSQKINLFELLTGSKDIKF